MVTAVARRRPWKLARETVSLDHLAGGANGKRPIPRVVHAPAALEPLARHSGAVDELEPTEAGALLARVEPDVAVNFHGRGPHSHHLLEATRPRKLLAFRHPESPASASGPAWREDECERTRWCRLLQECGLPSDPP